MPCICNEFPQTMSQDDNGGRRRVSRMYRVRFNEKHRVAQQIRTAAELLARVIRRDAVKDQLNIKCAPSSA